MRNVSKLAIALLAALVLAGALSASAPAISFPTSCGDIPSFDLYTIKSRNLSCKTARDVAMRWQSLINQPLGYRCKYRSTPRGASTQCQRGTRYVHFFEYDGA